MNKLKFLFLVLITATLLSACGLVGKTQGGFRGKWKAQDSDGKDIEMIFNEDNGKIGDKEFDYTISKEGHDQDTKYYRITVSDTYHYTIIFPDNDMKIAILIEPDDPYSDPLYGEMLYAMNRNEYPDFDDYVDKYLH
ncbi:hypothetical protein MK370_06815 [Streptococcus sanguinis]|uniref:LptM family lipoprotein n=1 Tax=Streptococcus sanguinis TaxID=1305 RepID=UPI0022845FBD|nr:hypothetical protein [Streptococcus sanguinis]MCY7041245.1 hypothetical protein [Streptococcus sanguinis]